MFKSARIKLTAWYLLIIMVISLCFSVVIYKMLTFELDRFERMQRSRIERRLPDNFFFIDQDLIRETKNRLKMTLFLINITILGTSAVAGYFLAGRTLRPISEMVNEQNRFISDSSHELRTPLTSLKTEIEVGLKDGKLTLAEAKKLLESNLEEVNNLQKLSDGLIKLTQYQKGHNGLAIEKISLLEVVSEAAGKVSKLSKVKSITIENRVKDFKVDAEKQSIIELFIILLDNAIKYSHENTKIFLEAKKTDGMVEVMVKDQGVGIEEKDIPHLFDRFYRADKSRTKSDVQGYGLGLSIAKQIVDKHRGTILVKSKLGEGTTFTIRLPINIRRTKVSFASAFSQVLPI